MKERMGLEKKFYDLCKPVVEGQGYTLYDLDYITGDKTLRVFIMDPETNSAVLDDCVCIDRELTPFFEENQWIPEDVILEVSSPGVFRKLTNLDHYKWSLGKRVSVKYRGDLELTEDQKKIKLLKNKNLTGVVENIIETTTENFSILLNIPSKAGEIKVEVPSEQIVKAQWEPEI